MSNPQHYKVILEKDQVRVLEYTDHPGDRTTPLSALFLARTVRCRSRSHRASQVFHVLLLLADLPAAHLLSGFATGADHIRSIRCCGGGAPLP